MLFSVKSENRTMPVNTIKDVPRSIPMPNRDMQLEGTGGFLNSGPESNAVIV